MTLIFVMNLGMAWGPPATPTFNPAWAINATVVVNGAPEQSVQR